MIGGGIYINHAVDCMGNKSFVYGDSCGYVHEYGTLARILISVYAHVPQIIFPINDTFPFNDTFPNQRPPRVLEELYARGDAFESPW